LAVQHSLLLLGGGQRKIYFLREDKITRIKDKDILCCSLEILYRSCPSGKTARPGRPSAGRIDLAVDVIAVDDGDISALCPRVGDDHGDNEKEKKNNS
jgi:hypothetical protein